MKVDAIEKYLYILDLLKDDTKLLSHKEIYDIFSERFSGTDLGFRCIMLSLQYLKLIEKLDDDKFKRTKKQIPKTWL